MNAVLLLFLASHLILPCALQQQKTCEEKIEERIERLVQWLDEVTDETVALSQTALDKVVAEAVGFRAQLVELTNGTEQQITLLQKDTEILKGRLAIAAIFSSVYMVISTLFMIGYLVVLVKKSVKKHQLKRHEEEVELMDQRLQEKRERRRAAARAKSGSPRQQ